MAEALKNLLLILVSQIPLLAVVVAWWFDFVQNPIVAALLGVLAEVFSLGWVFGKKVWEKLETDLVNTTADWIKTTVINFSPGFRRRYNRQIRFDHRVFNVRGLRTTGTYTLEVEAVFVELRIAPSHLQQARLNPLATKELSDNQPVWVFLRQLEKQDATALAIIGPPGSGKTTLLQHAALTLAANKQHQYKLRAYIPLLLFLREHVKTIVEQSPSLAELAQAHFSDSKLYPTLRPPRGWFAHKLEKGNCLVLLDGLDEVAKVDDRRVVSKWVDSQIRHYPRCRFILTARPQGYQDAPLTQAHVLEVQPFNSIQSAKFVHNWYLANKIISYGKDDEGVRRDAQREAEDLLHRLREQPNLRDLTVNPLLLTMVATVHNYRGVLPGRRVELYSEICDVLLGHWRRSVGVYDPLTAAQKRSVLQPLAAFMMDRKDESDRRTISKEKILEVISDDLKQVGLAAHEIDTFLSDVQASSGLLLEKETGTWSFAHLTFQEYLCATHWRETGIATTWDLKHWKSLVTESWWHETLRLYTAQGDATLIAKACLQLNTVPSLTLVTDIEEEALKLDTVTRSTINTNLKKNLEATDPGLRRLAAEVRLNRRLKKSFQWVNDECEIDLSFLTCAEYQLFLDHKRARGEYYQPDHWKTFFFQSGQADEPITGIRFKDAEDFCAWLTQNQGEYYRLPMDHEVRMFPISNTTLVTTWSHNNTLLNLPIEIEKRLLQQLTNKSNLTLSPVLSSIYTRTDSYILQFNPLPEPTIIEVPVFSTVFMRAFNRTLDIVRSIIHLIKRVIDFFGTRINTFITAISSNFDPKIGMLFFTLLILFIIAINFSFSSTFICIFSLLILIFLAIFIMTSDLPPFLARGSMQTDMLVDQEQGRKPTQFYEPMGDHKRVFDPIYARNRDLDRISSLTLESERVQALTRARELTYIIDLARALALNLNQSFELSLARELIFTLNRGLDRDLNLPLDRTIDQTKGLARDLVRFINSVHNLTSALNIRGVSVIAATIKIGDFAKAEELIKAISTTDISDTQKRQFTLLLDVSIMAQAQTISDWRSNLHQLTTHIVEYTYLGSKQTINTDTRTWWRKWRTPTHIYLIRFQQELLELYWFYQIVLARSKEDLPAWEGIRLVREHGKETK